MAVVTKNALAHGRRGVILTTTGIALALAIWITATAVGLSALLRASGEAFLVIKFVGAAYLAYLGVRTLLDSRRRRGDLLASAPAPAPAHAIFRQGFLSAMSNPKLGVFFVTFLPQFVAPGQSLLPRLFVLGVIFAVIGWTWMNILMPFSRAARARIASSAPPRPRRCISSTTATATSATSVFGTRS